MTQEFVQSPSMNANARTVAFRRRFVCDGQSLSYSQTTVVDIYGKRFDHTDENQLKRVSDSVGG